MNQERHDLHVLAGAYALDALEPAEREAFTAHLVTCEACRHEAAEFEATAARLAAAAAQPPPAEMKHRTMAAVDGVRQLAPRTATVTTPVAIGGALRRGALPFAVAASVAAALFGGLAAWQHQEGRQYEQRALKAEQHTDTVGAVLAAPDARAFHAPARNGAATTVVSSTRQNRAVFAAAGLPAPAPGRTYQLWLERSGTMRPAGFIDRDGTVLLEGDTAGAGAVGLTLEPAGGSLRPTTPPLVLLRLPT
ncbi:anti-sigma factor [Streptomyces sp. NBC_01294]|uniref:anti-sigma factor n=1 Tax=Streptomyces sp. NBC_01294 TaxID=2903815 RepID=UPI002DDAC315|nr:anti-sigma factor [Streptomyces sp. NBC_01294]WRZ56150.1 anti-sigma factor [Streptomyces sp. NBC_01294]